jgi:uncharacterized protein (DUF2225 family)
MELMETRMLNETPFLLSKVECPICKTINEFEVIKVGAYIEGGRDTDFCPKSIEWRIPRYQMYNPLVFFTAVCNNCFYARELTNEYREWKNDVNFKTYRLKSIKERHLEKLSTVDSVVKQLGETINVSEYPNESAVIKLHLAVFDEMLTDHPSALDIGRFYLRIGWVYRDMVETENPNRTFIGNLMDEVLNKYSMIVSSVETVGTDIDSFARSIESHFEAEHLSADMKARMLRYRERFADRLGSLREGIEHVDAGLSGLKELIGEYKSDIQGEGDDGSARFGRYSSFREFLASAKRRWDGVVLDEQEALKKAVHYYRQAFESGRDVSPGNQQIQVSYLIAELSRRVGDYDLAKQYFSSTIKSGQEFIYQNRRDRPRTQLARKIMELAIEQGRANLAALKPV